jgi:hypothetical protein
MKLPLEIIQMILRIKHYTAIKNRLENILKFPEIKYDDPVFDYYGCGNHNWFIKQTIINYQFSIIDEDVLRRYFTDYHISSNQIRHSFTAFINW